MGERLPIISKQADVVKEVVLAVNLYFVLDQKWMAYLAQYGHKQKGFENAIFFVLSKCLNISYEQ
jgi:hypothetical protein